MFKISSNGAQKHLFSFRFHFFYSTVPAAASSCANVLVEFLVNSLGFSTKEATSTSAKVTRSRLLNYEPHLLVDVFDEMGMNKSQIKTLVSSSPKLLICSVDKNIKPKIKALQQLGLTGSDLVTFIRKSDFLIRGLNTTIKPNLDYLKVLLGSHESVAKIVKKEPWLLSNNLPKVLPPNITLLQNLGCSTADIEKAFHRHPRFLLNNLEWLERAVHRLENDFHMPPGSQMFLYGIQTLASLDESKLERRLEIFRSFGWSDSDICTMVRRLPYCLATSEPKIRQALKFFMMELGYESSYLASRPPLLKLSLEKRIMPRNEILKFLKEKQLITRKLSLHTVVKLETVAAEFRLSRRFIIAPALRL
ncbi:hypothetical protein K7X08_002592 [Anisodus acutangulus]|uniref:Uncharacterized protein n=1 Tax=Anisodus acutangulus TaxID=402998 RepID=A0A9Q1R7F4_9SOLA|nr:hypothetical protein K7X08_002592 [Anisodus acutangulus]